MKKQTILIIEDETSLTEILQHKLEREGYAVISAADGKEGLKLAEIHGPDLILLDLLLPLMIGQEVLKALKKKEDTKDIPVIIISNSGQPVEIKELLKLGADDYIVKAEFNIEDILERVTNAFERSEGSPDILVAEDEAFLRMVLVKKLRGANLKVISTLDGDITLKNCLELQPKVLVLDLLMPGLSGVEILKALKKDKSFNPDKTKIIILSNYAEKEGEAIIKEMTEGYYIKSNVDIDEIAEKIKTLL